MDQVTSLLKDVREGLRQADVNLDRPLVVAVSGGPDSLALLQALLEIWSGEGALIAAHFNHRLRGYHSEGDARFVTDFCRERGIECLTGTGDVQAFKEEASLSLEDAARRMRYHFLAHSVCRSGAQGVATGHTMDDQAETVLLHIARGSGLQGLVGMRPRSYLGVEGLGERVAVLRPLLRIRREQTDGFCRIRDLRPRRDASNADLAHARNRIRSSVLPELVRLNPQVVPALHRLSATVAEDVDLLQAQAKEALKAAGTRELAPGVVRASREKLIDLPHPLQIRCLRELYIRASGEGDDLGAAHLRDIQRLLEAGPGRGVDLPGGIRGWIDDDAVVFSSRPGEEVTGEGCPYPPPFQARSLVVPGTTRLPCGWSVSAERVVRASPMPSAHDANAPVLALHGSGGAGAHAGSRSTGRIEGGGRMSESAYPTLPEGEAVVGDSVVSCFTVLDADAVGGDLVVRTRQPGDRFQPLGMARTKKLQDFFVDERVPRRWRDRVPLVVGRGGIAWVAGRRPAEWAKLNAKTTRWLKLEIRRAP